MNACLGVGYSVVAAMGQGISYQCTDQDTLNGIEGFYTCVIHGDSFWNKNERESALCRSKDFLQELILMGQAKTFHQKFEFLKTIVERIVCIV